MHATPRAQRMPTVSPQMTVRETLMFAARLRLPSSVPLEEKREVVDSL